LDTLSSPALPISVIMTRGISALNMQTLMIYLGFGDECL
jgi:hypothetical protein